MNDDMEAWIQAGCPEPVAAEEVDTGDCEFDCGAPADYIVQFDNGHTVKCCGVCSASNRLYVKDNDLLDREVTE